MLLLMALLLVSGTPGVAGGEAARPQGRVHARATAEIIRADSSSPETREGAMRRQVRRGAGGHAAVEFE